MKVLIVDDSPLARAIVSDFLRELPFIQEVEVARNGKSALEFIENHSCDLILLDVEMPIMDGITFLEKKRNLNNTIPVIMLSSYTQKGAEITFKALELGAIDCIPKPADKHTNLEFIRDELQAKLEDFYEDKFKKKSVPEIESSIGVSEVEKKPIKKSLKDFEIIVIGSSTGGPKVLAKMVRQIPSDFPLPIAIVQHMPEFFTSTLAERLQKESSLEVQEAYEGMELSPGKIVVAKGNYHLLFHREKEKVFIVHLDKNSKFNAHRPSIDKTIFNLIELVNEKVIGIILTGMGRDGVDALKELHQRGGLVIAQDEYTSVIYGMNKRAIEENAVNVILPDDRIIEYLLELNEF